LTTLLKPDNPKLPEITDGLEHLDDDEKEALRKHGLPCDYSLIRGRNCLIIHRCCDNYLGCDKKQIDQKIFTQILSFSLEKHLRKWDGSTNPQYKIVLKILPVDLYTEFELSTIDTLTSFYDHYNPIWQFQYDHLISNSEDIKHVKYTGTIASLQLL